MWPPSPCPRRLRPAAGIEGINCAALNSPEKKMADIKKNVAAPFFFHEK